MKGKLVAYIFLFILLAAGAKAQSPDAILNYINTYKDIAIQEMQRSGVPAAIKLAQGIHETEAGTSDLVRKSNNHFGIKCKNTWMGDKVFHDDDARGECFRSYGTPEESYRDHSDFLKSSPRYASLFQIDPTDYKAWAYGLKKAGYATNIHYPEIIIKLIEDYNLEQYTLVAMGKMKTTDETVTVNTKPVDDKTIKTPAASQRDFPDYPTGEFIINNTRVIFAKSGTTLLSIAEQYNISFARLLDFNDLNDGDILNNDQLIFLQRKRKTGANEFHTVLAGETIYDICQGEGIRMESLLSFNKLESNMQVAAGEKLYLRGNAPARPALAGTVHIVQTKETLYSISKKYGVSLEQIKGWNKLDSMDLKTGQQLVIYKN